MSDINSIALGQATDIFRGLNSNWDPASDRLDIMYRPPEAPLKIRSPREPDARGKWDYPRITLHDSAQSLLTELIPYDVVSPAAELDAPGLPAGVLLMGGASSPEALAEISETIGVDLTRAGYGYALVKLERRDGVAPHACEQGDVLMHMRPRTPDPELGLHPAFLSATRRLRHAGRDLRHDPERLLGQGEAEGFLAHFKQWGTHFVSRIDVGDAIVQVFAFGTERFERLKKAYGSGENALSGVGATSFVYFTTDANKGEFGYVSQYGKILCLSNSGRFRQSLDNKEWVEGRWARQDSVFAPFDEASALTLEALDKEFLDAAPTRVQLTPLSLFVEFKRTLMWQRVLKAALVQKFQLSIGANFAPMDERDFDRLLPEDQPGVVSTLATPKVNIFKARIDVGAMAFVAAEQVEDLTVFANVISSSSRGASSLPGATVSLYGQVIDMRSSGQPVVIEVADAAYDSLSVACSEFLGALAVRNRVGSKFHVVVDGLRYGLAGEGREADPVVVEDVRRLPPAYALASLVDGLQFSLALAEAVLGDQTVDGGSEVQELMRSYLRWVAAFIPATTTDKALLDLRVRTLDLASYAVNPDLGSFVPILPFNDYQDYVERILEYASAIELSINQTTLEIDFRRQAELVIDVAKTLNQNIVESGELITKTIEANERQQRDLNKLYDGIIEKQKVEARSQEDKVGKLEAALFTQQAEVDAAAQRYKSVVQQWQAWEGVKFGLEVATNLFSLGTNIAIPATSISSVKELGKIVQMIQKTLNVLNATWKLYSGLTTEIDKLQKAQQALDDLDGSDFGTPSASDWDEATLNFKAVLATGPSDQIVNAAKTELESAFTILVSRGKAVLAARSTLHQIQREIYANQSQQEVNVRQAERLKELKDALHPKKIEDLDLARIDLIGLTGHLSFLRDQMLAILAKAFAQQDRAMQYAYLQPATPILSYSVLKFREARVRQQAATIAAKERLSQHQASITQPIDYLIEGVRPEDVTGGNALSWDIHLDSGRFLQYVDVRVVSVVAEVGAVVATDTGRYHLALNYAGSPFLDRNTEREARTYRTPWRERVYEYEAPSGKPLFTDGGASWSKGVSRVTPFSTWSLSFPDTSTNEGITLDPAGVTIRLRFVLEARIVDARELQLRRLQALGKKPPAARSLVAEPVQVPSTSELVAGMFAQGACTNGWDVVFNMSLNQIDRVLKEQYEALKNDTTYKNTIKIETRAQIVEGAWSVKRYDLSYGYPQLSFSTPQESDVRLQMELKGTVQSCLQLGDAPLQCDPPKSADGSTLTAYVKIERVFGTVDGHDVIEVTLDMRTGAFSVDRIELDPVEKLEFNRAVVAYFADNPVKFLINRLDLTQVPTIEALRPKGFLFKKLTTPSTAKMLQLFIQTGNRSLLDYSQMFLNGVPEPIPKGEECSMILRTGLLFQSVIPASLNKDGWLAQGTDPGNPSKAWTGVFTQANVVGTVDLSKLNRETASGETVITWTKYTYYIPGGRVSWSLAGMELGATDSGRMKLTGTQSNEMKYKEKICRQKCSFTCGSERCSESDRATGVSLSVYANLSVEVEGSGREQAIRVKVLNPAGTVTGRMAGGGPSGSDDLATQVNNEIRKQLPPQLVTQLNVPFDSVSVFALKNLLFPSENYIKFEGSYVPGDLLVVGKFVTG